MKIIHVPRRFTKTAWGGTENVVLNTAKAQLSRGCKPFVFTSKALDCNENECIDGIPVRRFDYCYPFFGLTDSQKLRMDQVGGNLMSLPLLQALWKEPAPDVLHLHSGKRLGGIVRTISRIRRIPYVISLHGGLFHVPEEELQRHTSEVKNNLEWGRVFGAMVGARRVIADADAVICVGKKERQLVRQMFPRQRVEYLPNGVDSKWFMSGEASLFRTRFNIPANRKMILNVGRIDKQKNQLVLIEALPLIHRQQDDVHLVLIGPVTDYEYLHTLQDRIRKLHLKAHVTIVDGIDQKDPLLRSAYHAADIFCLPSIHEPFGMVILEAWASRCPVLASRIGGIPDFTEHRTNIQFVENNFPWQWSVEIVKLLNDPCFAAELAFNGYKKAARDFDWSVINDRLMTIYEELLK